MKKYIYRLLFLIIICFAIIFSSGCNKDYDISELYEVTYNDGEFTYDYVIRDRHNNTLLRDHSISREPNIDVINEHTLSLSIQTGTGLSTRWTTYCDVDQGIVSEKFMSVLDEYEDKVIFVSYHDGIHSIVVQNIFDKDGFFKETVLTDAIGSDPVCGFIIEDDTAEITYHKTDVNEVSISIDLE